MRIYTDFTVGHPPQEIIINEFCLDSATRHIYGSSDSPIWKEADYPCNHDPYKYLGMGDFVAFPPLPPKFNERHQVDDCLGSFECVQRVARVLNENYRVSWNPTTGFHVHVVDIDRGFPMEVVKRLMALVWAYEPGIEKVHPPPMRRHDTLSEYWQPLCSGVRPLFPEIVNPYRERGIHYMENIYTLSGKIKGIEAMPQSLIRHVSAYNLGNLRRDDEKKTIEFRHHAGKLDGERSRRWAMFCVLLVRFSQRIDVDELIEVWRRR